MRLAQIPLDIGSAAQTVGVPGADTAGDAGAGFGQFLGQILGGVFAIATLLVFMYLIWGAIEWISSGGDKSKVEKARNRITQAVIGLLVLASTLVIMVILQGFLGYELFNFVGGRGTAQNPGSRQGQGPTGRTSEPNWLNRFLGERTNERSNESNPNENKDSTPEGTKF